MKNQYTKFAGVIYDNGVPIGLAFPIDVGTKTVNGPEAWRISCQEHANKDKAIALLIAYGRGEVLYEEVRHLLEDEPLPEPVCTCFLPQQSCSVCIDAEIDVDQDRFEKTGELPF